MNLITKIYEEGFNPFIAKGIPSTIKSDKSQFNLKATYLQDLILDADKELSPILHRGPLPLDDIVKMFTKYNPFLNDFKKKITFYFESLFKYLNIRGKIQFFPSQSGITDNKHFTITFTVQLSNGYYSEIILNRDEVIMSHGYFKYSEFNDALIKHIENLRKRK
jgi:hypothetical protein